MITIIKAIEQVTGSEIIWRGTIICIILFFGIFIAFKCNRRIKPIFVYLLAQIIVLEICDYIWLSYLFPNGEYFNRGLIAGASIFFILPLILLIITISLTVFNKNKCQYLQHKKRSSLDDGL